MSIRPLKSISVGDGSALVLLHGFAMQPRTYLPTARLIAARARVLIPAIFELPTRWTFDNALACIEATLEAHGIERYSLLGHSFGGGLELGLAARHPDQVVECVFADTLGVKEHFGLAEEALHNPLRILSMATPRAASAFVQSACTHPWQLSAAGWWGFRSDREPDMDRCAASHIPCHVLWASRDSILSRSDGQAFARELHATFTVASEPRIDHDWMFDDPELFVAHLEALNLKALS